MIVVTGPGRSGTSLLARLYQELGFDPVVGGGGWEDTINGGLEDIEVGHLNLEIIHSLGMQSPPSLLADRVKSAIAPRPAPAPQAPSDGSTGPSVAGLGERVAVAVLGRRLRTMRWDRLDEVVERLGPRMRQIASTRQVVKDPQFCQTLHAWAAADAQVEQVVVTLRNTGATASGLLRTGHLPSWVESNAPNHVAYRLGLLFCALYDHRLEHAVLRFPDFLKEPEHVYDAIRFPAPVERDRFTEVFRSLVDPGLVHSWS